MPARGAGFERLMRAALKNHPGEFRDRFEEVYLWNEYPDRDGPDIGIDLVAVEPGGRRWAIQCKFYEAGSVSTGAINSFLALAASYDARLLVYTSTAPIPDAAMRKLIAAKCRILYHSELDRWDVDWLAFVDIPDELRPKSHRYTPHPYQREAIDAIVEGFETNSRGRLILPCGTGKSVVALWATESLVNEGGHVLYVVPSIALMGQTMREWSTHRDTKQQYIGICSDTTAGWRGSEDANLTELSIPVTTDPHAITAELTDIRPHAITVVFSTYQSLQVVADAQAAGAPQFDLMICDEAHRTTGVHREDEEGSGFTLPHDEQRLLADRRLYMTATPRLYTANAKEKAAARQVAVYSMDDEGIYGPEFYRMSFADAVRGEYLSEYEVAIVAVSDGLFATLAGDFVAEHADTGVNVKDVVRLLGCWDALADPTSRGPTGRVTGTLNSNHAARRAIAFSNKIVTSKRVEEWWPKLINACAAQTGRRDEIGDTLLNLNVDHIDGKSRASLRAHVLDRLRSEVDDGECRVVTNARCLAEGVDVPTLDAVLFLEPRKSKVDIVQAVGRVMRTAEGKKRGYIVLPVIVPQGKMVTDSDVLNSSEFQPVWDVIQALRAHDERMDVWVNTADKGGTPPIRVIDHTGDSTDGPAGDDEGGHETSIHIGEYAQMSLPLDDAIASALVERCGDKRYWATWADDVGEVSSRIAKRIQALLERTDRPDVTAAFACFVNEMRQTINEYLQPPDLVRMLACHLVTLPVFEALFGSADFAMRNPVVRALAEMTDTLEGEGLQNEARELGHFYDSVRDPYRPGHRPRRPVEDPAGPIRKLLQEGPTRRDRSPRNRLHPGGGCRLHPPVS